MNQALFRLAAVLCLVGIGSLCFQRFAEGQGPHLLPTAVGEYLDGLASSTDWQARAESNHRRLQTKYAIVTELITGRLTLRKAAARFGELDAEVPGIRDRLAHRYPSETYEVALCREVIAQARSVLRVRAPDQMETVLARLEEELQIIQGCKERPSLPRHAEFNRCVFTRANAFRRQADAAPTELREKRS